MHASSLTADDKAMGEPQRAMTQSAGARVHRQAPPKRFGVDLAASKRMGSRLRTLIRVDAEPDAAVWDKMGQALWQGDPLADALVSWMHEQGLAKTWPLFERALSAPDAITPDTPEPLRDYVERTRAWPNWVRSDLMREGARALQSTGLHGMKVLRDAGLMAGYEASAINQTLVQTGALHKGAQRRVAETTSWWLACTRDDGMRPGGEGFKMTLRVRLVHALVRYQLSRSPEWDADYLGVPINQLDMQATYLAFGVVQLLSLKITGALLSRRESNAVMHLWRYIGWLMGVDETMLCDDERHGQFLLYQNVLSQAPADDSSVMLARALMDEPLHRMYGALSGLRGRFNKAMHLSLIRWFIGSRGMKALGLPPSWPWYPLLVMAPLVLRSAVLHAVPGLMPVWTRWAGQRQQNYLQVLMGTRSSPHLTGSTHATVSRGG